MAQINFQGQAPQQGQWRNMPVVGPVLQALGRFGIGPAAAAQPASVTPPGGQTPGQPNPDPAQSAFLAGMYAGGGPGYQNPFSGMQGMDWKGFSQFLGDQQMRSMHPAVAAQLGAFQNFGPAMQGAMSQMGDLLQRNAAAQSAATNRDLQAQLLRENRHDQNQKWTMVFDALLKPQAYDYQDANNNRQERMESPLLRIMSQLLTPNRSQSQFTSQTNLGTAGGTGVPINFG